MRGHVCEGYVNVSGHALIEALEHRGSGHQTGERVGDGVAAEAGCSLVLTDQSSGDRGVVTERDTSAGVA
jgi:hypothetical protein